MTFQHPEDDGYASLSDHEVLLTVYPTTRFFECAAKTQWHGVTADSIKATGNNPR